MCRYHSFSKASPLWQRHRVFSMENCKYKAQSLILSDSSILAQGNIKWNRTACIMRAFDPRVCCRCETGVLGVHQIIQIWAAEWQADVNTRHLTVHLLTLPATIQLHSYWYIRLTREVSAWRWCLVCGIDCCFVWAHLRPDLSNHRSKGSSIWALFTLCAEN